MKNFAVNKSRATFTGIKHAAIVLSLLLLTLGACAPHHSNVSTNIQLPIHFYNKNSQSITKFVSTFRWWENFHNPSLNLIMEKAFQGNLDLKIAFSRLKQAEAINKKAGASLWPSLDLEASAGRSSRKVGSDSITSNLFKIGLAASYEIDLWHKLSSLRQAALLEASASEADLRTAFLTISAQTAEAFFKLVATKEKIVLTSKIIKSFQESVELVEARYAAGLVSALDLYQARQNLLGAEAELPILEKELETARNSLALLIGSFQPLDALKDTNFLAEPDFSFEQGLPADLLLNRPDISASLLRVKALDAKVAQAVAERFPSFNILGSLWYEEQELSRLFDFSKILWSIVATGVQPIFDAGKRAAEVESKKAQLEEALAKYRKAVLEGFKDVENALVAIKSADQNYNILKKRLKASESSLRMALEQYTLGVDTFLPVLEAQSTHAKVQIGLVEAKRLRILGRIQLARALGGRWMHEEIEQAGLKK